MNNQTIKTEVLIVGGGPVGLAMANELRYQGIDCLLIEQSDGEVRDPKVSTVGARSMEFARRWGIAQQIRDAGWPKDHTLDVAWVTAVGGHEIFRVRFPSYAERSLPEYTPEPEQVCPQNWFAPVFLNALGQYPGGLVKLHTRLDDFEQNDEGIIAQVTNLELERRETIQAQYLIACDGASSRIRKACGVEAPTFHATQKFQSVVFKAPELPAQLGEDNAMVFFLVNPTIQEPLRSVDGQGSYRLILKPQADGEIHEAMTAIKAAIAIDTPIEIISNLPWHLTHRVAENYNHGRIFFVGDAAHTLSPSGGFGMNTGIADAVDLGWKLAATLKGWASPQLLDTYEMERKPIAVRNLQAANANLKRSQKRAIPPVITTDSPAGEQIRQEMAEGMKKSNVRQEFDAPGIHFGFRYQSPAIAAAGNPPRDVPQEWQQNSYPGCRAPHAWLESGKSTLDLFGHGLVLLNFKNQEVTNLEKVCEEKNVPLRAYSIDNSAIAQVYEKSYVLVRPDGHVAWRGDELPNKPEKLIDQVRGYF